MLATAKAPRWDVAMAASWWRWAGHIARVAGRDKLCELCTGRAATPRGGGVEKPCLLQMVAGLQGAEKHHRTRNAALALEVRVSDEAAAISTDNERSEANSFDLRTGSTRPYIDVAGVYVISDECDAWSHRQEAPGRTTALLSPLDLIYIRHTSWRMWIVALSAMCCARRAKRPVAATMLRSH